MYKAMLKAPDRAGSRHIPFNAVHKGLAPLQVFVKLFRLGILL